MKTLISPRSLFSNIIKPKVKPNSNLLFFQYTNVCQIYEVGIFVSHRDVKVATEELQELGFELDGIVLIARKARHHHWQDGLIVYNHFAAQLFGINQINRHFFQRQFRQGKYLLLVTGTSKDVELAGTIMGRRRGYAEVWNFQNNVLTKLV